MYQAMVEAARELGRALRQTQTIRRLHDSRVEMEQDAEVQGLLKEFWGLRKEYTAKQRAGTLTDEDYQTIRQVQERYIRHPKVMAAQRSSAEVRQFLQDINQELTERLGFDFAEHGRPQGGGCCG